MLRSVGGTVFQTAVLSMVINPETASRVTLATLGIVFQTKLITNYKHGAECCLPDKTYYQLQTWSLVLAGSQYRA